MRTIKTQLALIFSLLVIFLAVSNTSQAEPVKAPEQCWKESKIDLADGQFVFFVDTEITSSSDLLQIIKNINSSPNVMAKYFPRPTHGTEIEFTVVLRASVSTEMDRAAAKRAEVIAQVNALISDLAKLPGVQIECNLIFRSNPAGSTGN